MSGGVDSSVAAYLAAQNGFECAGITMKLFDIPDGAPGHPKSCCSLSDVNDARDAAYKLGIPHYVLNMKKEFEHDVIGKFIRVYEEGGTPNPCIDCNRYVKFNTLMLRAREIAFDVLATGHYARIEKSGGRLLLKKAIDTRKDQSYVLYMLTQNQLENTFFPLGALKKDEVRAIAHERGFINAAKQDSQDICFVPDGNYAAFIERWTNKKYGKGAILDIAGNTIGVHDGQIKYTIGQRRGLGISAGVPLFVCAKSAQNNTVTLGIEETLYTQRLDARDINLIAFDVIPGKIKAGVKTRYTQEEAQAVVEQTSPDTFSVEFEKPQRAVARGQAAVLYDGDTVLGGGTIM